MFPTKSNFGIFWNCQNILIILIIIITWKKKYFPIKHFHLNQWFSTWGSQLSGGLNHSFTGSHIIYHAYKIYALQFITVENYTIRKQQK